MSRELSHGLISPEYPSYPPHLHLAFCLGSRLPCSKGEFLNPRAWMLCICHLQLLPAFPFFLWKWWLWNCWHRLGGGHGIGTGFTLGLGFPRQLSDIPIPPGSSSEATIGLEWADPGLYLRL